MPVRLAVLTPMSMLPSTMGPTGIGGHVGDVPEPVRGRDGWEKDAEKFAESDADGGDGAGLDDEEERPAVKKSPERPERLAQINVLAAGLGHHGGQFAVAECADEGHDGGDHPRGRERARASWCRGRCRRRREKMPEPIMEPATMAVELKRPRLWTKPG